MTLIKPLKELGSIAVVTLLTHLVGSAILACVTGGPLMILATPFVAFFGWFMLIPEFAIVAIQWEMVKRQKYSTFQSWLLTVLAVCVAFTCIAPKEQGNLNLWITGYALGSLVAFSTSFAMIYYHHSGRRKLSPQHEA